MGRLGGAVTFEGLSPWAFCAISFHRGNENTHRQVCEEFFLTAVCTSE